MPPCCASARHARFATLCCRHFFFPPPLMMLPLRRYRRRPCCRRYACRLILMLRFCCDAAALHAAAAADIDIIMRCCCRHCDAACRHAPYIIAGAAITPYLRCRFCHASAFSAAIRADYAADIAAAFLSLMADFHATTPLFADAAFFHTPSRC